MHKKALAAMTAVGLTAAIAIPTIAFGNARRDLGSFNFEKVANTPLTAKLLGANEVPAGDPDGVGAAAVTIDFNGPNTEVCCDRTYRPSPVRPVRPAFVLERRAPTGRSSSR